MNKKSKKRILKKSSFRSYQFYFNNNNPINRSYTFCYPFRNEIIIKKPEEIIKLGYLKDSINLSSTQHDNNTLVQSHKIYENLNHNLDEINNLFEEKHREMTNSIQQKIDDFKFKKNNIENQTQEKLKIIKDSTQGEIIDSNSEIKNENVNISKSISELPLKDFNIPSETQQPNDNNVPGNEISQVPENNIVKTKKY